MDQPDAAEPATGPTETADQTPKVDAVEPAASRPTPLEVTRRLQQEGRWKDIEPLRDQMMRECRKQGMLKADAQAWTYAELDKMYPPPELQQPTGDSIFQADGDESQSGTHAREGIVGVPADWPSLPDNATLAAELGWVQAQRLRVVEQRNGNPIVRLDRAGSPPPSWAALGWLETAIRNPSKFADICAKGLGQQELESDLVKRERRSIEDVRRLLAEMQDQHK